MSFPYREPAVALRGRFQNGIFVARQEDGMGTALHVSIKHGHTVQIKWEKHSKPLAQRHGNGMVCVNPPLYRE
jgi:hypothetical protein